MGKDEIERPSQAAEKLYSKIDSSCNDTISDFKYRYLTGTIEERQTTLKGFIDGFYEYTDDIRLCLSLCYHHKDRHPQKFFDFMVFFNRLLGHIETFYADIKEQSGYDEVLQIFAGKHRGNSHQIDKALLLYFKFEQAFYYSLPELQQIIKQMEAVEACSWLGKSPKLVTNNEPINDKSDKFTLEESRILYIGKDLRIPTGDCVDILTLLIKHFGNVVVYKTLDTNNGDYSADDKLRTNIGKINDRLKQHETPYIINSKRKYGYFLTSKK